MLRYIHTNRIQLRYLDYKSSEPAAENEQPLLLLHGLTHNAYAFEGLVKAGLSPKFRVLSVDLRGHGMSDKPAHGYTMSEYATDLIGVMDLLGLKKVVLGGHSFGGWLAMYLAGNHPDRVAKTIIFDVAAEMTPSAREMSRPSLLRLGKSWPSWEEYLSDVKKIEKFTDVWDVTLERLWRADVEPDKDGNLNLRAKSAMITEAIENARTEPWDQHLAKIGQSTLLINPVASTSFSTTPAAGSGQRTRAGVKVIRDCHFVQTPGNYITMLYGDNATRLVTEIINFIEG